MNYNSKTSQSGSENNQASKGSSILNGSENNTINQHITEVNITIENINLSSQLYHTSEEEVLAIKDEFAKMFEGLMKEQLEQNKRTVQKLVKEVKRLKLESINK